MSDPNNEKKGFIGRAMAILEKEMPDFEKCMQEELDEMIQEAIEEEANSCAIAAETYAAINAEPTVRSTCDGIARVIRARHAKQTSVN